MHIKKIWKFNNQASFAIFLGIFSLIQSFAFADYQLGCRYYDKTSVSQNTSFFHPGLPWVWARGENNEYVYVKGKKVDGFFEVSSVTGRSSGFFSSDSYPYENSFGTVQEFCNRALEKAFPEDYKNKTFLDIVVKSSFLSLTFLSPVFSKESYKHLKGIDRMVIFGDSLSDQGNLKNWLRVFPPEPYFAGRFSNGPIWIDYLQQVSGLAVQNWAIGGSVSLPHFDPEFEKLSFKEGTIISASLAISGTVRKEINRYQKNSLTNKPLSQADSTLFVIWIGGNDYLTWLSSTKDADIFVDRPDDERAGSNTVVRAVTDSIGQHLRTLYEQGARKFMVVNLPDLGTAPRVLENESYHLNRHEPANKRLISLSEGLTRVTRVHNHLLQQVIDNFMNDRRDVNITMIDPNGGLENSFSLLETLPKSRPNNFGLDLDFVTRIHYGSKVSIINRACYSGSMFGAPSQIFCSAPNSKIFWDNIHPSSYPHCLIALNIHKNLSEQKFLGEPEMQEYLTRCKPELL